MALTLRWEKRADEALNGILHFRLTKISETSARKFMVELDERLELLVDQPGSGRPSRHSTDGKVTRYQVIGKSHRLYYTYDDRELLLIDFVPEKAGFNPYEQ